MWLVCRGICELCLQMFSKENVCFCLLFVEFPSERLQTFSNTGSSSYFVLSARFFEIIWSKSHFSWKNRELIDDRFIEFILHSEVRGLAPSDV